MDRNDESICSTVNDDDETDTLDVPNILEKQSYQNVPEPPLILESITCDACPYCSDVCGNSSCESCLLKKSLSSERCPNKRFLSLSDPLSTRVGCCDTEKIFYTMCEVRRHNHINSAWLRAGDTIYDATKYIKYHPAGSECILLKAGGCSNCSQDIDFHSKRAKSMWRDCRIGKLKRCPGEKLEDGQSVCVIS